MAKCCLCGISEGEVEVGFSDNFVSYGDLYNGSRACRLCHLLVSDQRYRRSHWILLGDGVKLLSKSELLDALLSAPEGSLIYVKSKGKKLTFLRALKARSTKNLVAVCGEDEGLIMAQRGKLKELVELGKTALALGFKKSELLEGPSTRSWAHREVCERIEEVRGDPLWLIVVRSL